MPSIIPPTNPVAEHLPESMRVKSSAERLGSDLRRALLGLIFAAAGVSVAHATTVSWGSEIRSDFRDSNGNLLNATFTIQIGFFERIAPNIAFTPTEANVADWNSRWRVFDQATLNLGLNPNTDDELTNDHFASRAEVNVGGTSDSPFAARDPETNTGIYDFQNQTAYIWIRNSTNPVPGTEWFLATAPAWIFPPGIDDCCDPALDLEFSVTDLQDPNPDPEVTGTPVTPVWGRQSGTTGSGVFTATSPLYTLQTFTFVPEPSTLLLTLAGSCLLLIRRRPTA